MVSQGSESVDNIAAVTSPSGVTFDLPILPDFPSAIFRGLKYSNRRCMSSLLPTQFIERHNFGGSHELRYYSLQSHRNTLGHIRQRGKQFGCCLQRLGHREMTGQKREAQRLHVPSPRLFASSPGATVAITVSTLNEYLFEVF